MIIAQGGAFAGWSLYATAARRSTATTCSASSAPSSKATVPCRRATTRYGWSSTTTAAVSPRARPSPCSSTATRSATDASTRPCPWCSPADETTDVGHDSGTGVSDEYRPGDNEFTGTVHWVQIDIDDKAEDFDHLITPEERWQIAMARQYHRQRHENHGLDPKRLVTVPLCLEADGSSLRIIHARHRGIRHGNRRREARAAGYRLTERPIGLSKLGDETYVLTAEVAHCSREADARCSR